MHRETIGSCNMKQSVDKPEDSHQGAYALSVLAIILGVAGVGVLVKATVELVLAGCPLSMIKIVLWGGLGLIAFLIDAILLLAIGDRLRSTAEVFELAIPFSRGDVVASLHREGEVLTEYTDADGMRYSARLAPDSASRLEEWIVRD